MNKKDIEIKDILPHRGNALMIDEIIELTETKAVAVKLVKETDNFLEGHFPKKAVMPAVIIIECMAQTAALILHDKLNGKMPCLVGVNNAKFTKFVIANDRLLITAKLTKKVAEVYRFVVEASVNNNIVAEAEIIATIKEF